MFTSQAKPYIEAFFHAVVDIVDHHNSGGAGGIHSKTVGFYKICTLTFLPLLLRIELITSSSTMAIVKRYIFMPIILVESLPSQT